MELAAHGTSAVPGTSRSPSALRALHAAAHVRDAAAAATRERGGAPEPVRAPESATNERAPSSSSACETAPELSLESSIQPAAASTSNLN